MPKSKNNNLGVRVDDKLNKEISAYAKRSERTVAQLFRLAIREYMWSHPLPQSNKQETI